MPYTPAHSLAVWPLRNFSKLSLPALVIGSMTPDFEHVLRLSVVSKFSHDWPALFWFCLPSGLLLYFFYDRYWKFAFKQFFPAINIKNKNNWLWISISLLIGGASHILWDSFTHPHRMGEEVLPFLSTEINLIIYKPTVTKFLQHISTVVGTLFLGLVFLKAEKNKNQLKNFYLYFFALFSMAMIIAGASSLEFQGRRFIVQTSHYFLILAMFHLTYLGYRAEKSRGLGPL